MHVLAHPAELLLHRLTHRNARLVNLIELFSESGVIRESRVIHVLQFGKERS